MIKNALITDKFNELSNCSSEKKLIFIQRVIDEVYSSINNKITYMLFCLPYLYSWLFFQSPFGVKLTFIQGLCIFINLVVCMTCSVQILSVTSRFFCYFVFIISGFFILFLLVNSFYDGIVCFTIYLFIVIIAIFLFIYKVFVEKQKSIFDKKEVDYISIYFNILISCDCDSSSNKEYYDKLLEKANELYSLNKTANNYLIVSLIMWLVEFVLFFIQKI